jgi:signal transduction histidine kinase
LHRRISGLEQERDTARAQTVAAVTAEAAAILTDRGLHAALTALAGRSTVPAEIEAEPLAEQLHGRLDAAVETAAYFVIAEALANVAKHSQARRCAIGLRHDDGTLRAWVTDDGVGGAALDKGHGLRGLDDRVHAIGGRLRVTSPRGGPTTVTAELPCR